MVQLLWKIIGQFLKKLKIKLLYDPTIPFWGYTNKKTEAVSKTICTPMFKAALFIMAKS